MARHHGVEIDISPSVVPASAAASIFWGLYEKAETKFIRRHLAAAQTVVELGASLGITSAHILSVMHSDGRFIAVEAHPMLAALIEERVARHVKNQVVEIVEAAITDHIGVTDFNLSTSYLGSGLLSEGHQIKVPAITLAHLVERYDLTEYALVTDIEGAEASFLFGDSSCLTGCRILIAELQETSWRGRPISSAEQYHAISSLGFQLVDSRGWVVVFRR